MKLLGFLNEHQGIVCTYPEIRDRLWQDGRTVAEVLPDVRRLVSSIKKAIQQDVAQSVTLKVRAKHGYILTVRC